MDENISPFQEGQQFQRWFLGIEQRSERPISIEEANILRKRIFAVRVRPLWILMAVAFSITLIILCNNSFNQQSEIPDVLITVLGLALIFIGLPFYILFTRDSFREAKALKSDLVTGKVFIFEGPIAGPLIRCKTIRRLFKERLFHAGENPPQQFDVLPISSTVFRINGILSRGWRKGRIVEATAPPARHYDVLIQQGIPGETTGEPYDLYQRHMSQAEIVELKNHIVRFRKPPRMFIVMAVQMLILIAAVFISVSVGKFSQWQDRYRIEAGIVCVLFVITLSRYIRDLRTARLMIQDAGIEVLRIVKPQDECEGKINQGLTPVLEFLPNSLLAWSVNGRPYPWRLRKPRPVKI
jgi:hypothetical protein